jgi:DNA-binding NtrC family response regulator
MQTPHGEPCIYIVDDESALAQMTHAVLGLHGYKAAVFNDPAKALAHIQHHRHESVLLITDCIMGSMNGLELIEEVKKSVPKLRTILLSGTITDEFIRQCQVQPDRFIAKPFVADTLVRTVGELVKENSKPGI